MPRLIATWNPDRGVWETDQPDLFGRSEPYSATWCPSGMTLRGSAYELPTWVPRTADTESSSSPGLPTPTTSEAQGSGRHGQGGLDLRTTVELLRTPTAQLADNGGSQHPDKRRMGGHTPTLADQVEHEM